MTSNQTENDKPTRDQKVAVLKRIARAASASGDSVLFCSAMNELAEYGVTSWQDFPGSDVILNCIVDVETLLQQKIDAARSNHMRTEFTNLKRRIMWKLNTLSKPN